MSGPRTGEEEEWPKSLPQMKVIDELLRCGICFDYYNIAMIIPQCSHNYCSLCIRKFLSYKTQCPTCRVAVVEHDLRNNRVLDELVKNFNSARKHLFQFVLDSPPISPAMLRGSHSSDIQHSRRSIGAIRVKQESACMDNFLLKASTLASKPTEDTGSEEKVPVKIEGDCDTPETSRLATEATSSRSPGCAASPGRVSTPGPKEVPKVDCPVCGVGISEQYINRHLDSCLTSDEKKESLRSSAQKRKPMAKVVYNLLSDRELRKKLKEVGLAAQGPKQQLIKRHQEFVHMYNAQCDSLYPKSAAEIIKEIEQNEKTRAQLQLKSGEQSMTFTKDQSEQEIEGIHSGYRQKHKNEFQLLIDQVKNRWQKPVKKELEEDKDHRKTPTRLKEDIENQCPEQLSVEDPSPDMVIVGGGEDQSVNAELGNELVHQPIEGMVNVETADRSLDFNKEISQLDGSPDVLKAGTPYRSASPSFPLSPHSRASSSSDILRDLEEVKTDESSDISFPEVKAGKRKSKSQRVSEGGKAVTKSKRSRK
ncbi:E3 ubiquitin-protein ligase RAD18 isoform X2 [Lissotriton helveticus]